MLFVHILSVRDVATLSVWPALNLVVPVNAIVLMLISEKLFAWPFLVMNHVGILSPCLYDPVGCRFKIARHRMSMICPGTNDGLSDTFHITTIYRFLDFPSGIVVQLTVLIDPGVHES
jgi:hypothetical protein